MIEDDQSEMDDDDDDDDLRRDDQYKQVFWSGVSHINMCEGIGVEIAKNVREKDEDGWEGIRKVSEGGELGEYSIWQGGESVVVEGMKGMRV